MKAIVIDRFGKAEEMHLAELPDPKPAENEVIVDIHFTSLNPVDWKIREGYLKDRMPHHFPIVLGWDAAGTISQIGKGVTNWKIGDEVYAYCRKPEVQWGSYAEKIALSADAIAHKPKTLGFAEAAALPLTSLTAWQALFDVAKLQRKDRVLVHAGAGGVGSMAIQFAHNAGALVYTTASARNHGYVTELGAYKVIDYTKEDFAQAMKRYVPEGVEVIFDCAGGQSLEKSYDLLRPEGTLVSIVETPDANRRKDITAAFHFVSPNGEQLAEIARLIDARKVRPPHIQLMPLAQAKEAHALSEQHHTRGKIVLQVKG